MTQKILTFSFFALFFLTPLIWTPWNYELFEYNKMLFIYGLTVIILGVWGIRAIREKKLTIKSTPLDIPLLLFLLANILSTIFSIDPHTSIWGYYSRSNGGLLSIISYIALYYAFVSNFTKEYVFKFLKAMLWGGFLVALYAIPEHFGVSPSCVALTGKFGANCWVQDVQARVFATLGQPNWLAAYLAMLIFPCIYFILTAKSKLSLTIYSILLASYYLAFTFTYSRGATLGFLAGLGVFIVLQVLALHPKGVNLKLFSSLMTILAIFLLINLLFGSALTGDFKLIKQVTPPRPTISLSSASTQLETGGTESGQIRLIVWKGALEIFKHYPIFGSGVETFAYSYYNFRPAAHNLVSEWDFLYNKAHNEYLNYLATTGLLGFASYCIMIITFIIFILKKLKSKNLVLLSLLASYTSFLVQNIFGFSVVMIALFFFLFPAFSFLSSDSLRSFNIKFPIPDFKGEKSPILRMVKIITLAIIYFIVITLTLYFLYSIFKIWTADTIFSRGVNYSNAGNPGRAYNELFDAVSLNPDEPLFKSELGFAAAASSVSLATEDASLSSRLKKQAILETQKSLSLSPKNLSLFRTAVRTYYALSNIDPKYNQITLHAIDESINLAPTDAKLYYNKALILANLERMDEAIKEMQKAIKLKPNYREAILSLGQFYLSEGDKEKAKKQADIVLKLIPNDKDGLKLMEEIKK